MDTSIVVMYRFIVAGFTLSLISEILGWNIFNEFLRTPETTLLTIFISLFYFVGIGLWYYGIKNMNLSKATSIMITHPLISAILAIIIIGERLSIVKLVGISIVYFSVLQLSRIQSFQKKQET
jgi:drug/metabolite transporter (DMT)-like permease